jgi:hypothetical protein
MKEKFEKTIRNIGPFRAFKGIKQMFGETQKKISTEKKLFDILRLDHFIIDKSYVDRGEGGWLAGWLAKLVSYELQHIVSTLNMS